MAIDIHPDVNAVLLSLSILGSRERAKLEREHDSTSCLLRRGKHTWGGSNRHERFSNHTDRVDLMSGLKLHSV